VQFLDAFAAARRVSTPLIAVTTPDPTATINSLTQRFNGETVTFQWDLVRGMTPVSKAAVSWVQNRRDDKFTPAETQNPVDALLAAQELPERAMLIMHNMHRYWSENDGVIQAVWNLRDQYKQDFRQLVMLCTVAMLPPELAQDTLVLDDPLPTEDQIKEIITELHKSAKMDEPGEDEIKKTVDATLGLAAFPAEQAIAMCMTKTSGINFEELWEIKRKMVEMTPGLQIYRGRESFQDVAGIENAKAFGRAVLDGKERPRAIVWIDEIEKMIGTGQDTSGVSQSLLGTLLSWMQDRVATGLIAVGPPGAAKSLYAKALGGEAGIPTIQFDLTGMKASLVGESEGRLRTALKVVDAVSQGNTLFVATCNAIANLPPELRRRFRFGTFFFDLPTREERTAIWALYCQKFGLDFGQVAEVSDEGWTGAEVWQCCDIAWRLNYTLAQAAGYVVPVSKSAGEQIEKLRKEASGKYISASHAGLYQMPEPEETTPKTNRRGMRSMEVN
jgi:hypothetical protein